MIREGKKDDGGYIFLKSDALDVMRYFQESDFRSLSINLCGVVLHVNHVAVRWINGVKLKNRGIARDGVCSKVGREFKLQACGFGDNPILTLSRRKMNILI